MLRKKKIAHIPENDKGGGREGKREEGRKLKKKKKEEFPSWLSGNESD